MLAQLPCAHQGASISLRRYCMKRQGTFDTRSSALRAPRALGRAVLMSSNASAPPPAPSRSGSTAAKAAGPSGQLKWNAGIKNVVLFVVLASTIFPRLAPVIVVAAASFMAGLAVPRPQALGYLCQHLSCTWENQSVDCKLDMGPEVTTSEIESLRRRLADLETEVRSIALTGVCVEDNHIAASRRGLNVTAYGPEMEVKWAHSTSRMRERILFLWGEMALQYFGLDEESYWPQLARCANSEAFLQRNKWFLESVLNYNVQEEESF